MSSRQGGQGSSPWTFTGMSVSSLHVQSAATCFLPVLCSVTTLCWQSRWGIWFCPFERAPSLSQNMSHVVFSKLGCVISLTLFRESWTLLCFCQDFTLNKYLQSLLFLFGNRMVAICGQKWAKANPLFYSLSLSVKCPVLLAFLVLNKGIDLFSVLVVPCVCRHWAKICR